MNSENPIEQLKNLLEQARKTEPADADAAALATVSAKGYPSVRMVLVRQIEKDAVIFFTNLNSKKSIDLKLNPHAALCFYWKSLEKQVRIEGVATPVQNKIADDYFATRHRQSQIGAWASDQSAPLENRAALEQEYEKYTQTFGSNPIPRPPHWTGFRVEIEKIEFWDMREFRLHDRLELTKTNKGWNQRRLYP